MSNKHKKLHMIGNAHIDPVWLWNWQEGFQEVKATYRSALDRMKEYPDFLFTCSSAAHYEWVEKNDPAMFEEIRQRVQEGRWEVVGGWWVQPDCNIPSGESFVRQGLYGQRYFKEKLGVTAKVGYNVDSFGHAGMFPQILKKSGMDYYVFMRPGPHEMGLPGRLFWWESDDGTRVLTFRIPFEYLTWGKEVDSHARRCAGELKDPFNTLMCFYGVGNHGGGPTKENIESICRLHEDPEYPQLVLSTPNRFFADVRGQNLPFPVVHTDLQHHASGCYAAHSGIKHWNRRAESALLAAEKWSALAERVTGQPYPMDELRQAWKNVLFNQFHDIMAGTSLESAYEDARNELGESLAIAARALNYAIQSISWKVGIEPFAGKPVVVFNPHPWAAPMNVELEYGGLKETDVLLDDQGRQIPLQTVRSEATVSGWRKRISFTADLPAMGYRTYRVITGPDQIRFEPVAATDTTLENGRFRLEIDPETGYIKSLMDKRHQYEVFRTPEAAKPVVIEDKSDTWSHGVFAFDKEIGAFKAVRTQLIEHGPVKSVLRVTSAYGGSTLMQDFTVYRDLDQIDVKVSVDWHEQHKALKLRFPVSLHFPKATYETPYGHIERPVNGEEEPGQSWIDLSGVMRGPNKPYGLSLINDAKYSYSVRERDLELTVLRSPIYAHHDPYVPTPEGRYVYMDQGLHRFTYTLLPHDGGWEQGGGTVRRALELNQRPVAVIETYHEGPLPQAASYAESDQPNVVVTVIKRCEDDDAIIVRAYETDRVATAARLRLFDRIMDARFGPCEIKTFKVPRDPEAPIVQTNLLEWSE